MKRKGRSSHKRSLEKGSLGGTAEGVSADSKPEAPGRRVRPTPPRVAGAKAPVKVRAHPELQRRDLERVQPTESVVGSDAGGIGRTRPKKKGLGSSPLDRMLPEKPSAEAEDGDRRRTSSSETERSRRAPFAGTGDPASSPAARRRLRRRGWFRGFRVARTLYVYTSVEVLRIFLLSLLAISLIGSVLLAFQLTRSGIRIGFLWPILQRSLAYPLFFSLPISLLFGVTLGLGRLAADLEITAMKTHGLSHLQIAAPLLAIAVAATGLSFYLNAEVIPRIHYEKGNLRDAIVGQLEDLGSGRNRSLLLPGQVRLFVKEYQGSHFRGIKLELQQDLIRRLRDDLDESVLSLPARGQRSSVTLLAHSCVLDISPDRRHVFLKLQGVEILVPETVRGRSDDAIFRQKYSLSSLSLPLKFLEKRVKMKDHRWGELVGHRRELDRRIAELAAEIRDLDDGRTDAGSAEEGAATSTAARRQLMGSERDALEKRLHRADTEIHRRVAFSGACFTFVFLGIPLVFLTDRRNRLIPFFIGNVVVVLPFLLLVMLGILLGERGFYPAVALGLANAVFLALGGYLWYRLARGKGVLGG